MPKLPEALALLNIVNSENSNSEGNEERVFKNYPPSLRERAIATTAIAEILRQHLGSQRNETPTSPVSTESTGSALMEPMGSEGAGMSIRDAISMGLGIPGTYSRSHGISQQKGTRELLRTTTPDFGPGEETMGKAVEAWRGLRQLPEYQKALEVFTSPPPPPPQPEEFPWIHLVIAGLNLLGGTLIGARMGAEALPVGMAMEQGYLQGAYKSYLQRQAARQAVYQAQLQAWQGNRTAAAYLLQTLTPYLTGEPKGWERIAAAKIGKAGTTTKEISIQDITKEEFRVEDRPAQEEYWRALSGLGWARLRGQQIKDFLRYYYGSIGTAKQFKVGTGNPLDVAQWYNTAGAFSQLVERTGTPIVDWGGKTIIGVEGMQGGVVIGAYKPGIGEGPSLAVVGGIPLTEPEMDKIMGMKSYEDLKKYKEFKTLYDFLHGTSGSPGSANPEVDFQGIKDMIKRWKSGEFKTTHEIVIPGLGTNETGQ